MRQIVCQRSLDTQCFSTHRMLKFNRRRVQRLTLHDFFVVVYSSAKPPGSYPRSATVLTVCQNGTSDMSQMDPDLVSATGLWHHIHNRVSANSFTDFVERIRRFAGSMVRSNGHFFPLIGMNTNWNLDFVAIPVRRRRNHCDIPFPDGSLFELSHQCGVSMVSSCHHNNTAGIAIQSVNDSRSMIPPDDT